MPIQLETHHTATGEEFSSPQYDSAAIESLKTPEVQTDEIPTELGDSPDDATSKLKGSYASLVNPVEGTMLPYIPASIINGKICVRIDCEDVIYEINYWQSAMLCMVLRANPPLEVVNGFVRPIWSAYEIDKVCLV